MYLSREIGPVVYPALQLREENQSKPSENGENQQQTDIWHREKKKRYNGKYGSNRNRETSSFDAINLPSIVTG